MAILDENGNLCVRVCKASPAHPTAKPTKHVRPRGVTRYIPRPARPIGLGEGKNQSLYTFDSNIQYPPPFTATAFPLLATSIVPPVLPLVKPRNTAWYYNSDSSLMGARPR